MIEVTVDKVGHCSLRRCNAAVSLGQPLCAPHWRMVPPELQRALYAARNTYRAGRCSVNREAYRQAIMAAVAAVDEQLGAAS